MSGRPVRLLMLAALAAMASLVSVSSASAGCYSCGCAAPVVYAPPPCAAYYAGPPMYVVNQGPAYNLPVPIAAEPTPAYHFPFIGYRNYAYYGAVEADEAYPAAVRYHRHHHRYRMGAYEEGPGYGPAYRRSLRVFRPHIGPRAMYYGYRSPRFAHMPRVRMHAPYRMRPMHMNAPEPGVVTPQRGPKKKVP